MEMRQFSSPDDFMRFMLEQLNAASQSSFEKKKLFDLTPAEIADWEHQFARAQDLEKRAIMISLEIQSMNSQFKTWWSNVRIKYQLTQSDLTYENGAIYEKVQVKKGD